MGKPLSVGGRVAADLITDLQTSHQKVLMSLKEIMDCASQDDSRGVLLKLAELFPEMNNQKTTLFELETLHREAARRGPYGPHKREQGE